MAKVPVKVSQKFLLPEDPFLALKSLCKAGIFDILGYARIQESLNLSAFADSSTDARRLKMLKIQLLKVKTAKEF